jgi:hypothetical protein
VTETIEQRRSRQLRRYYAKKEEILAKQRVYCKENKEKISKRGAEYHEKNKEKRNAASKKNYGKKPHEYYERCLRRRHAKLQRTPKWLTEEHIKQLQEIIRKCPKGYEIDHIVPLQGKNVSGLHVPWNIQYLPKTVNRAKWARHESD